MSSAFWTKEVRFYWMSALFAGCVCLYAARIIMPICSSVMSNELYWSRQDAGLVLGIFFWGYSITQYLGGFLSDMFGGETVIVFSTMIWGFLTVSFTLLRFTSNSRQIVLHSFLLTRFLLGAFQGFFYPSLASLMAKRISMHERQFTYAFITSGTHVGTLLCGSIGSLLLEMYGWRISFLLIGAFAMIWAIFVYRRLILDNNNIILEPTALPLVINTSQPPLNFNYSTITMTSSEFLPASLGMPSAPVLNESAKTSASPLPDKSLPYYKSPAIDWGRLLLKPAFWAMLFGNFVFNNTFFIILNWLPSYFHDEFPDARSWVFNLVPWLIAVPCSLICGFFADKFISQGVSVTLMRKLMSTVALFGSALFLCILPHLDNYVHSLACISLAIACCGFHNSGILLNPQDIAPAHGGRIYGVMSTVGTIPGFFGVYLTGYILHTSNSWSSVFYLTSIGNIIGWIVYCIFGSANPII